MAESVLERRTFETGQKIFDEGQVGNHAYIVQSGRIEIVKMLEDRGNPSSAPSARAACSARSALIDDQPRMAMARAAEMTTLIFVSRIMFEQKMVKVDPFVRGLLKILVGNIRSLSAELERRAPGVGELTETAEVVDAEVNPDNEAGKADGDA